MHPGALMVYVGKQKGFHTRTQEEIHDLLLAFAGQGASVLRWAPVGHCGCAVLRCAVLCCGGAQPQGAALATR